jgi:hypothetical protein
MDFPSWGLVGIYGVSLPCGETSCGLYLPNGSDRLGRSNIGIEPCRAIAAQVERELSSKRAFGLIPVTRINGGRQKRDGS